MQIGGKARDSTLAQRIFGTTIGMTSPILRGSMNILGHAFAGLFDWADLEVTMLGRAKAYPVSTKRLVAGV